MNRSVRIVHQGQIALSSSYEALETTLGSCVAVVLIDSKKKIVGLNHIFLAERSLGLTEDPFQYAEPAIIELIKRMKAQGSQRENIKAYIFGGAKAFGSNLMNVGERSVQKAEEVLKTFQIPVIKKDVGGPQGRQIRVHVPEGDIFVRNLNAVTPKKDEKKKILIVEDSPTMQKILKLQFSQNSQVHSVEVAATVAEAKKKLKERPFDIVSLDINLPDGLGLDILRTERKKFPQTQFILITECNPQEGNLVLDGLALGAYEYLQKPALTDSKEFSQRLSDILKTLTNSQPLNSSTKYETKENQSLSLKANLLLIGASTGGTEVIKNIFEQLKKDLPPIVMVQHMPPGFTRMFAERLTNLSPIPVTEVTKPIKLERGKAYLAAGATQMQIYRQQNELWARSTAAPAVNRFQPSVDYLFESITQLSGQKIYGVAALLTGMGYDGAAGLKKLKDLGFYTITQSAETCLVYGMPRAADDLQAATTSLAPAEIAQVFRQVRAL